MMSVLPAPKISINIITSTIYKKNINCTSKYLTSEGLLGWNGTVSVAFIPSADSLSLTCPGKCYCPEGEKIFMVS